MNIYILLLFCGLVLYLIYPLSSPHYQSNKHMHSVDNCDDEKKPTVHNVATVDLCISFCSFSIYMSTDMDSFIFT